MGSFYQGRMHDGGKIVTQLEETTTFHAQCLKNPLKLLKHVILTNKSSLKYNNNTKKSSLRRRNNFKR